MILWDVAFGAVSGCLTCYFLFHHLGLINYEQVMKLLVVYTKEETRLSNVETNQRCKVQPLRRRINRSRNQIEAIEKNVRFPFDSPVIGEREPLWSHRYSAKLEVAASKIYQAWREGEADGWTLSTNLQNGLEIFLKKRAVGLDIIKGVFRIPYPVASIIREVHDVESISKFDATVKDCKKLATYGQGGGIQYTFFKSLSQLIWPRDMVFAYDNCHIKGENVLLSPAVSVAFLNCPKTSGKIRTELHFGGWVFEVESPDSTMATYIVATDLKGSLPTWIVDQTIENMGRTPLNLSKFMEEKYGTRIPKKIINPKVEHLAPVQQIINPKVEHPAPVPADDDEVLYGPEEDAGDSIDDSSEESLEPIVDPTGTTETRSTTPVIHLGNSRLTTHEQATMLTKLNLTIADVEKFTDYSSKNMWKRMSSNDKGVKVYKLKDGKSGCMGKSIVKFEAQKIFEVLKEPSFRMEFDPMLKSLQVVEKIGELYVVHMQHETKHYMTKIYRDMLVAWGSRQLGPKYVVAGTSITHPGCPSDPKMKRINIDISGWVVEEYRKRPGYSLVHFVLANVDYGKLPEKVVTYVNKRQVMAIHDLALAIKRRDQKRRHQNAL